MEGKGKVNVYLCQLCHYRTTNKNNLNRHILSTKHISRKNAPMIARKLKRLHRSSLPIIKSKTKKVKKKGIVIRKDDLINNESVQEDYTNNSKTYDIRLVEHFKMLIVGPSRCGKSQWIGRFLQHTNILCRENPTKVIWIYSIEQEDLKQDLEGWVDLFIEDRDDLPKIINETLEQKRWEKESILFVFDDMMNSPSISWLAKLFTVTARHKRWSAIVIGQRYFGDSNHWRQICDNNDYLILFKNPVNRNEVSHIARKINKVLPDMYEEATKSPYSYLMINNTQTCDDKVRFLSNLFAVEGRVDVYVDKRFLT